MDKLFPALCLLWIASEVRILWHRRSGDPARKRDAGTLRLLMVVIGASAALAAGFDGLDVARFARPLQAPLWWLGIALMLSGMGLRWWSIRVLARHFTVDVAIRPDHELVRRGPYRLLRHPSYTGLLMTFLGFALCLGNWLRSEEHTSELQSLMRISYAVLCLKKKKVPIAYLIIRLVFTLYCISPL